MISLAMFNNKGGVGKTTLTYHLAHMIQRLGIRVLAADLDPQSNLTAEFLDEDDLAMLWHETQSSAWTSEQSSISVGSGRITSESGTVAQAVRPIMEGLGDIADFDPIRIAEKLWLLPGDLEIGAFEDKLSEAWPKSFRGTDKAAIRTTTALHRIITAAADKVSADLVLIDVGPNLGAINRAALLTADAVLMPLAADLFSLRGLRNLGPTLRDWRSVWQETVLPHIPDGIVAPRGVMHPLGYIIMQPSMRLDRPVTAYGRWLERMPSVFQSAVLGLPDSEIDVKSQDYAIATIRNYQSLMPLAHDARKPMFDLRSGDGAIGSTQRLVQRCYDDFRRLSEDILKRLDIDRPSTD